MLVRVEIPIQTDITYIGSTPTSQDKPIYTHRCVAFFFFFLVTMFQK
jgi:hypothetical protein